MNENDLQNEMNDIFVARQPIFDTQKNVYAYELLFKTRFRSDSGSASEDPDAVKKEEHEAIKIISNTLVIGLNNLTEGKKAFINFNRQLLLSKVHKLFPTGLLAVEILEPIEASQRIIGACERLKKAGYSLVLGDYALHKNFAPLLYEANILKINFLTVDPLRIRAVVKKAHSLGIKLLADKVETKAQYEDALELGYDYFQGFFFQEPDIVTTPEMPGHKLNYYEILRKVASADPDFNEIEKILKRDVSLTYKLLRFINSASYGFKVTVRSIRHALALLGKRELRKWLTLIALGGLGAGQTKELMTNALIRSRFCELIGKELNLKDETADLFLVGMFSVADAMLNRSMEMICGDLPLDTEIKSALLGEVGLFRDVLEFVTAYEKARWKETARIAKKLKLPEGRFVANYLESVQWAREF